MSLSALSIHQLAAQGEMVFLASRIEQGMLLFKAMQSVVLWMDYQVRKPQRKVQFCNLSCTVLLEEYGALSGWPNNYNHVSFICS